MAYISTIFFTPKTGRSHGEPLPTPTGIDFQNNNILGHNRALSSFLAWGGPGAIKSLYSLPHFQINLLKWLSI